MTEDLAVKLVKVDNWGIFLLQRLQQLFTKGDFCDLTLKFASETKVKVHRLVVNACTEYFVNLEKQGNFSDGCLELPNDLHPDVVVPIINFMYSGRLEFREDRLKQLYSTAQQMNMTVLTKLLDAQSFPVQNIPKSVSKNKKTAPVTWNLQGKKIVPKQIDPDFPNPLPGRKLPIWKRRSAPPKLPSFNSSFNTESRPFQPINNTTEGHIREIQHPPIKDEPPKPTRFEWPEEDAEMSLYSTPFDNISYETTPLQRPKEPPPPPVNSQAPKTVSFEELRKNVTVKRPLPSSVTEPADAKKRRVVDLQEVKEYLQEHQLRKELIDDEDAASDDFDDSVAVADLDDDDDEDREPGQQPIPVAPMETPVTPPDAPPQENVMEHEDGDFIAQVEGVECQERNEAIQQSIEETEPMPVGELDTEAEQNPEETAPPEPAAVQKQPPDLSAAPQKSILKTQTSKEGETPPVAVSSKKVRFSLENDSEGKENVVIHEVPPAVYGDDGTTDVTTHVIPSNTALTSGTSNINNLSNHAKIISEVLKKYPHLVKDNKNIRLKIMQKGHAKPSITVEGDSGKVVKSKVSYVVVKSSDAAKGKQAVVLKHGTLTEPLSEVVPPEGPKRSSGAENTTGPWLCYTCGTNEQPINFETYYSYRRHLQDIHQEKIDARICEHCGHRASKRNLLLYHLYTKHSVPPPRNCQFPKCDQCEYVALSESLLIKHRNNHSNAKDFVCKVCNASFKSNGALQGHMQTNLHSDPTKKAYECPFCQRPFMRNINLKAHIRAAHKEVVKKIEETDKEKEPVEPKPKKRRTKSQEAKAGGGNTTSKIKKELHAPEHEEPQGLQNVISNPECGIVGRLDDMPPPNLVPSSEAEALSNVASGIAASLGLADSLNEVSDQNVVQEQQQQNKCHQQFIYQQPPVHAPQQEYIVPEILENGTVEVVHSYSGPLSDLEHYTGENNSNCALTSDPSASVLVGETIMVSAANTLQGTHVVTTPGSLKTDFSREVTGNVKGVVPLTVTTTGAENTQIVHFAVPSTLTETGQIVHLSVPTTITEGGTQVVHLSVPTSLADAAQGTLNLVQLTVPTTVTDIVEQSAEKILPGYSGDESANVKPYQELPKLERQVLPMDVPPRTPGEDFGVVEKLPPILVREIPMTTPLSTTVLLENPSQTNAVHIAQELHDADGESDVSDSVVMNRDNLVQMESVVTESERTQAVVAESTNTSKIISVVSSDEQRPLDVRTELVKIVKHVNTSSSSPSVPTTTVVPAPTTPPKKEQIRKVLVSKSATKKPIIVSPAASTKVLDLVPKVTTSYPSPKKKLQLGLTSSPPKIPPPIVLSDPDLPPSTESSSIVTQETLVTTQSDLQTECPTTPRQSSLVETESVPPDTSEPPVKPKHVVPEKVKVIRVVKEVKKT